MTLDDLKEKVLDYENSLKKIKDNRKYWQERTKPLLINTLGKIKDTYPLDWSVQVLDERKNLEAVNITFNNSSSGIMIEENNYSKIYNKLPGTIVFSQIVNGNVIVNIVYPYIEDLVSDKPYKLLEIISPELITEKYIFEKVSHFLKEITNWENSNKETTLGYVKNR